MCGYFLSRFSRCTTRPRHPLGSPVWKTEHGKNISVTGGSRRWTTAFQKVGRAARNSRFHWERSGTCQGALDFLLNLGSYLFELPRPNNDLSPRTRASRWLTLLSSRIFDIQSLLLRGIPLRTKTCNARARFGLAKHRLFLSYLDEIREKRIVAYLIEQRSPLTRVRSVFFSFL